MILKQKLLLAFAGFVMLMTVLGVWVYIMIDNVQYAPAPPTPVPNTTDETKVTVEQKSQEEIDKLLNQEQNSSQNSSK